MEHRIKTIGFRITGITLAWERLIHCLRGHGGCRDGDRRIRSFETEEHPSDAPRPPGQDWKMELDNKVGRAQEVIREHDWDAKIFYLQEQRRSANRKRAHS